MSSARNPRDLKQMVTSSHKDMDVMLDNLSKLRSLSEDEKTENGLLRSRIDEQSQLIMILKQRADEVSIKLQALERTNAEYVESMDQSNDDLQMNIRKYNILDDRFGDLASNHEEMIKIKDDYKRRNLELKKENNKLIDENARLFSKEIEERDEKLQQLELRINSLRESGSRSDERYRDLEGRHKSSEEKSRLDIRELKSKLEESEERLKGVSSRLLQQQETQRQQDDGLGRRLALVTKEKDELLDLAMQRGKLIQEKQADNKKLQQQMEQTEKKMRDAQSKFDREAAAVSVNLTVRQLQSQLSEAEMKFEETSREFNAFKKHSNGLLQQEKELNAKLRHLMS